MRRLLAGSSLFLALAAAAPAQDYPPADPEPAPSAPAEPDSLEPPARPRRGDPPPVEPIGSAQPAAPIPRGGWMLDLSAEGVYESNVPYAPVEEQGDYATRLKGRLARSFASRRSGLELGVDGGGSLYREITSLNRFTWGIDAAGLHNFSRRGSARLLARSAQAWAREDPRLITATLPPLVLTRSDTGRLTTRWEFVRRWRALAEGRGERFRFDTPVLRDGWTAGGRFGLERAFRRTDLGGVADYERTSTLGRTVEVASLLATTRVSFLREAMELRVEGGASRYRTVGLDALTPSPAASEGQASDASITPTGIVDLLWRGGSHAFAAQASRRVQQTYGLGTVGFLRTASLRYVFSFSPGAKFHLSGTHANNDSIDGSFESRGRAVTAGFDAGLPGGLTARLTYSYWDRVDPFRDWHSHTFALALGRRFDWR